MQARDIKTTEVETASPDTTARGIGVFSGLQPPP